MTNKNVLEQIIREKSKIGNVLKSLVVGANIDDDDIAEALRTMVPPQRMGERLVQMGKITEQQLFHAVATQDRIRTAKNVEEIVDLIQAVDRDHDRVVTMVADELRHTGT